MRLANATTFRDYCATLDFQCLAILQFELKNLFDLCAFTKIFEIEANRGLKLRISLNNAANGLDFKGRVGRRLPLVFDVIIIYIFE